MPCTLDDQPLACFNIGAVSGGKKILDCEMQCPHQLKIREYIASNSDVRVTPTSEQC